MRTKVDKHQANSNSGAEDFRCVHQALASHNQAIERNRRLAKAIKGKSINLHQELAHLGGIKVLVQALNTAVLDIELLGEEERVKGKNNAEVLRQTRDLLIREHYGLQTWNLIEFLLA